MLFAGFVPDLFQSARRRIVASPHLYMSTFRALCVRSIFYPVEFSARAHTENGRERLWESLAVPLTIYNGFSSVFCPTYFCSPCDPFFARVLALSSNVCWLWSGRGSEWRRLNYELRATPHWRQLDSKHGTNDRHLHRIPDAGDSGKTQFGLRQRRCCCNGQGSSCLGIPGFRFCMRQYAHGWGECPEVNKTT